MNKQIALAAVLAVAVMLACVAVSDTSDATIADIEKPDTVTNPDDGTAICTVDGTEYTDFSSAITAATESDKPMVLSTDYDCGIASIDFTGNLEIDLNGKTLAINLIVLTGDESLTISNGTLFGKFVDNIGHATVTAKGNASIVLDDVDYYSEATGAIVYDKASVTLQNGTVIHAEGYGLGTNASEPEDYDVRMTIRDSAVYADPDPTHVQTAILFNIPGTLTIENSTIQGYYQAVIVRGGEAVITNSTITNTMNDASLVETFENEDWGTGNAVPTGALIVGNKSSSYQYPTSVDITDSDIVSNGTAGNMCAAVTVCANTGEGLGVEMVYDELSTFSNGGDEPSITIGSGAENVVAGTPVIMVGDKGYVTLQSAVGDVPTDGTETTITLLDDILLSMIGDSSQGIITIPVGANVIIDLNGNDITVSGNESGANQYAFSIYGEMTLRDDSQEVGKISSRGVDVESGGVFNLESGTIDVVDSTGGAAVYVNGEFNMSGGTLMVSASGSDSPCIDNRQAGTSTVTGGSFDPSKWTIRNLGTLDISGVTLTSDTVNWNSIKVFTGNVNIENCTFDLSLGGGVEVTSASGYPAPEVTVSNSEFTQSELSGTQSWNSMCVAVSGGSSVTVNNCTFNTVAYGFYVFSSGGSIEVNGGTYTATGDKALFQVDADTSSYPDVVSSAVVNGGTFKGALPTALGDKESLTIYGGKFLDQNGQPNTAATQYVAEGYAIDEETGSVVLADDVPCVAKIGDREFASLNEALVAAVSGQTIVLQSPTTESITISADLTVTIDLNGYTIRNSDTAQDVTVPDADRKHTITNNGTLIIKDGSNSQTGTVDNVSHGKGAIVNYGTFILESGKLTRSSEAGASPTENGGNSWYVLDNHGTMTVNGGSVVATGKYSSLIRNIGDTVDDRAVLNIYGGEISNGFIALKNDDHSTLVVTDGTISSDEQSVQNWGIATISGGTLNGNVASWSYNKAEVSMSIGGTAVINGNIISTAYTADKSAIGSTIEPPMTEIEGGTINGEITIRYGEGSPYTTLPEAGDTDDYSWTEISGGIFTEPVEDRFLAPGFVLTSSDGGYSVEKGHALTVTGAEGQTVTVTPSDGGEPITSTDGSFLLADGEYTISADAPAGYGYESDTVTIVGEDQTVNLNKVLLAPTITAQPQAPVGEVDADAYTMSVAATHAAGDTVSLTFQWYLDDEEIAGAIGNEITINASGSYHVVVTATDGDGLESSASSDVVTVTFATPGPEPGPGGDDDTPVIIPPIDDDDDYVPLPPQIVVDDSDDDDSATVAACAAAAVIAAILAAFIVMEYRRK